MIGRLIRFIFVLLLVAVFLIDMARVLGESLQAESGFSGASAVISQSGTIGDYSLPDPAKCSHDSTFPYSEMEPVGQPMAAALPGYSSQKVGVQPMFYSRAPDGTLLEPHGGAEYSQTVGASLSPVAKVLAYAPVGGDYVFAYRFAWYAANGSTPLGAAIVKFSTYQNWVDDAQATPYVTSVCASPWPEHLTASPTIGIVNSKVNYALHRYPMHVDVPITWDGLQIGSVTTGYDGEATGSFHIPAAPRGPHTIRWNYGHWQTSAVFTVKPRIKIIPNLTSRDATVNVSLRGYVAGETVRIRWLKGSSWVQIATVTTSATGSANINVKVPKFVPDGATKVRGDSVNASGGRAQTNAVSVFGGPFSSSSTKTLAPTPTITPTATASPSPATTQTPEATASLEATTPAATPEASETAVPSAPPAVDTPSPEPTETATATPAAPTVLPTETAPGGTPTP